MLKRATEEEIEKYMDFAYELVLNHEKSGYPVFTGSTDTKDDFIKCVWRSFYDKDRDLLLFILDGKVEGWIQYFYIEEDKYLQTDGFNINKGTQFALSEFINFCSTNFSEYDIYFGFPKSNTEAVEYLKKAGCKLSERAYHDEYNMENYTLRPEKHPVIKTDKENFNDFRRLHSHYENEMYWTSDRIYEKLHEWTIYSLYEDEKIEGTIYCRNNEIFGVDFRDGIFNESVFKELVIKILNENKKAGVKNIIFFNDEDTQKIVMDLGFTCICDYVLYIKNAYPV